MAQRGILQTLCHLVALAAIVTRFPVVYTISDGFDPGSCPTGFANFGDSLTDTGNALNAFPLVLDAENPPYGETFFGRPAKRFSNGRLVPDFFSIAFRKPLLDGYFSVTTFEYQNGINFAEAGATANVTASALSPFSLVPFQIGQYIRFIRSLAATQAQPIPCGNFFPSLPFGTSYTNWLYTVTIGGNDFLQGFQNNASVTTFQNAIIPAAVQSVVTALNTMYSTGARRFLIFGLPAIGCSTVLVTAVGPFAPRDTLGCVIVANQLAQLYNAQLLSAVQSLRASRPGARFAFFSYYDANIEILTHPTTYGFNSALILTACCGAPGVGTLNYNPAVPCGRPGSNNCANPEQYVNWDGIHFTEAFYRQIAKFALTNAFTDGGINYAISCGLDFSKFGPTVTYNQVYPFSCTTTFA